MKKVLKEQDMGKIVSGNAEYWHASEPNPNEVIDENNIHWRKLLPAPYYNMHTLGALMFATESVPVKVSAKVTYGPEWCAARHQYQDNPAGMGKTNYSNTFKKITGMTVWDYILNARVELAANFLLEKRRIQHN